MAGGRVRDLQHFHGILETLDAIVWEADAETFEFTYVNEAANRILGYPVEEWIGNPGFWESLIHPEDRDKAVDFCLTASRDCRDHQFDYRAIAADGRTVWIQDVVRVVPDAEGNTLFLRGVMTDITDRIEAKALLAESEMRYRLLSELTSDYAWSVVRHPGAEFVFEWVTDAVEAVYGRRPEEVVGTRWIDVVHPDDLQLHEDVLGEILDGKAVNQEIRIRRPNGETRWVAAAARRIAAADGVEQIVGSSRDITGRKRAEHELEASELRFRAVFDNAPVGISTVDLDGRPVLFNRALVDMLGYPPEQLREMTYMDFTHPDDADKDWQLYQELQAGLRDSYTLEKRYVTADGSIRWIELTASLIRDREGTPVCGIGMAHDLTGRREAESERDRLQSQLIQSQKMEAVGRLAGGIAHDFNNILAVILNYATFIRDEGLEAETVRNDAQEIIDAAERAAALTRQMLVFSRREVARPRPLDLAEVVGEHARMLRRMLGESIELVLDIPSDLPHVLADQVHLEQVILNLAVNARDAMPTGGRLLISARQLDDSCVRLAVTDSGTGMPEAVRAKAFEPFFTTKSAAHGTGLGLSTVYGIVQSVGGEIEIQSEEGRGTTVEITLQTSPRWLAPLEQVESPDRARPLSVLVVEDADQVREITRRLLSGDGHDVALAASASEALALIEDRAGAFDIVITDVVMPEVSGVELARSLRERWPDLPILYVSGYPKDVIDTHGGLDGPLVEKPFTISDLRKGIAAATGGEG